MITARIFLAPDEDPPAGHYRAQWNDDYHHAWHVLLTGEKAGYYRDYGATHHIERTLTEGFAYQGEIIGAQERPVPRRNQPPSAADRFRQFHSKSRPDRETARSEND